jgi:hypothetical protein
MDEPRAERGPSTVRPEYRSLHKYLRDRYAQTVVLTFAQIEDLLGAALPEDARLRAGWWTDQGTDDTSPQSQAWLAANRSAVPNLRARIVTFERGSA